MSQTVKSNNNKVYRLVLTGGPTGGKTTGQARLSTFFESIGWRVYRVPQMLSAITGGGLKVSDPDVSDETLYRLYENLMKLIIQVENTYFEMASTAAENCLVICDGGTMDIRARMTETQWRKLISDNEWNDIALRDSRYNQVIHMMSLAASPNKLCDNCFATHDVISEPEARKLDQRISQAWVGHPYFDVVDNSTEFDLKIRRMISAVCCRLNIHIGDRLAVDSHKRKFLVSRVPKPELFPQFQDFIVVHDYLATPNHKMQARIRRRGQNDNWTYTHTIRCTQPDARDAESPELKMQISSREYELLLGQKDSERITVFKTRRCFLWNNQYFQLDIYEEPCPPRCRNLIMLETYTALKGSQFLLPTFLDVVREVTGDPNYSMYNLSKKMVSPDEIEEAVESVQDCKDYAIDREQKACEHQSSEEPHDHQTVSHQNPVKGVKADEHRSPIKIHAGKGSKSKENVKPHIGLVLMTYEKNLENLIRGKPVQNGHSTNGMVSPCTLDKLSTWCERKLNPNDETFSNTIL